MKESKRKRPFCAWCH